MKLFAAAAAVVVVVAQLAWSPAVLSQEAAQKPVTPQQQRMRDCNREATGMKGEERKAFMKECLSGKRDATQAERAVQREARQQERQEVRAERSEAQQAQQERMRRCNAAAGEKDLRGDARKAFMSDCLKAQ